MRRFLFMTELTTMNNLFKRLYRSEVGTIFLASVLSWLEALQFLIIVVFVAGFFKIDTTTLSHIFTSRFAEVHVEREAEFFRVYILLAFIIQGGVLWFLRRKLDCEDIRSRLKFLIGLNIFWIAVQLFFVFKMIVHQSPQWASTFFHGTLVLAIISKVFSIEIRNFAVPFFDSIIKKPFSPFWFKLMDFVFYAAVACLLYIPDAGQAAVAIFAQNNFNAVDAMIMAPGWAYLNGSVLNVDQISPMGSLMAMGVAHLSNMAGAFDYQHVIGVLTALTFIYYVMLNIFLRAWLGSRALAFAGTLLAIKLQVFNVSVAPMIWCYPQSTVLRHFWDAAFFLFLFLNMEKPSLKFMGPAVFFCGISLASTPDSGVCLLAAFYVYLFLFIDRKPDYAGIRGLAVLIVAPLVVALMVLFFAQGKSVLTQAYWVHSKEFMNQLFDGFGASPISYALRGRQFFAFFMGLVIPVVYIATIVIIGFLTYMKEFRRDKLFVVIIAIYGLGVYHEFILRSQVANYYVFAVPFVMVVCFWGKELMNAWDCLSNRKAQMLLVVGLTASFLTNPWFALYPNIFNLGRYDLAREKESYQKEFHFEQDVALIQRLTSPTDPVVLMSSFETGILMAAARKPFFYDFPLFESSGMRLNYFSGTKIFTQERFQRTIRRLEESRPAHIFIERKLWLGQISSQYYQYYLTLTSLIQYLQQRYEMDQNGKFLVALKPKLPVNRP